MQNSKNFRDSVQTIVAQIPKGRVMTYGQIAALCGRPRAARMVGGIAHHGNQDLPWQRVVKKDGSFAEGYPGGVLGHEQVLAAEGVEILNHHVNMGKHLWQPR